jgi:glycosyltransferase involved in cell wall biosynthesis
MSVAARRSHQEVTAAQDDLSQGETRNMADKRELTISIIIKALNEERHIAAVIESALAALSDLDGEVILADAASTDRTVEIAQRYPITIVQLSRTEDRSCGAGAQLGFQYSRGRYLCLIDADMRIYDGFLPAAIRFLETNPTVGGVGGALFERNTTNLEFAQRANRTDPERGSGPVTRLNGSGVYRRSAVESIGYLTDRNLHGGEELDLGARLHAGGWPLMRIDHPAIDHYGHAGNAYRLLLRRLKNRNSAATGELLKAALGRKHFWFLLRNDNCWVLHLLVIGWWLAIAATWLATDGLLSALAVAAVFLFPLVAMALRWRSWRNGLYSVAAWNVFAFSFLPGFLRPRVQPTDWIDSRVIKEASPGIGAAPIPSTAKRSPRPIMATPATQRI